MMSNIIIKIMKTINKSENHSEKKQHKTWYKLDLSANVYPTLQRRNFSNVFRLSVVLKEEIDPDTLQRAVDLTLPRFPAFKVALHKGIFWRYLEPNDHPGNGWYTAIALPLIILGTLAVFFFAISMGHPRSSILSQAVILVAEIGIYSVCVELLTRR